MKVDGWSLYLGGIECLAWVSRAQALRIFLESTLRGLCTLRDDCDDPYECVLAATCPRAAKIRRQRQVAETHRVVKVIE